MKKIIILFLATTLSSTFLSAQDCVRDSSIIGTEDLFLPAPWTPDAPVFNLAPACIGEAYQQSLTLNVPTSFTYVSATLPINSISIATTGAIINYPAGLTYSCDPPNCVFVAGTLGCVLLHGTPSVDNPAPDTMDLNVNALVSSIIDVPLQLPSTLDANSHLYLTIRPSSECSVTATGNATTSLMELQAIPNPFTGQTQIEIQSQQSGNFQLEIFDLLGHPVHSEKVVLNAGTNQIYYDGYDLVSGIYFLSISGEGSKSVQRLVKI
jgi:hypothetical protein